MKSKWYVPILNLCAAVAAASRVPLPLMGKLISDLSVIYHTKCVEILVHDDVTESDMDGYFRLMKSLSTTHSCNIYYMDRYSKAKEKEKLGKAVKCTKPMRVTVGDHRSREHFSKLSRVTATEFFNPVSLLFLEMTIPDFFRDVFLQYDSMVIGVEMLSPRYLEIYEVFRVDAGFPLRTHRVGNWSDDRGSNLNPRTVFSRRYDFEGKLFRTGSTEKWPLSTFEGFLEENRTWDGLYCLVWLELEKLLNFSSVHFKGNASGIKGGNGNWNGLVGMLARREIDVIVSDVRLTSERLEIMDFTYPLIMSRYQIYFKSPGYHLQWSAVFKPFHYTVWYAVIGWLVLGTLSLSIGYYWCIAYGLERTTAEFNTVVEAFFFISRSLCLQGSHKTPTSLVCRIIFFVSYMIAAVLLPSYSASLISSITTRMPLRPFDSIQGLIREGTYKLYVEENTAEYTYFSRAHNKQLKWFYERFVIPLEPVHYTNYSSRGLELVCNGKKRALFAIEQVMKLKNLAQCELLSLTSPLTKVQEGIALSKGDPFVPYIHHHVHRMTEAGLVHRIRGKLEPRFHKEAMQWSPVEAQEVFQIILFLLLGMIVSVLILLAELTVAAFKTKKKRLASAPPTRGPHFQSDGTENFSISNEIPFTEF